MSTKIREYKSTTNIKLGLFVLAILIILVSLVYTNWVVRELRDDNLRFLEYNSSLLANALAADLQSKAYQEEQRQFLTYNANLYARALSADTPSLDFAFNQVIRNVNFPIIITTIDQGREIIYAHRNVNVPDTLASSAVDDYLFSLVIEMDQQNDPIPVDYNGMEIMKIHFGKTESHRLEEVVHQVFQAVNFPMIITREQDGRSIISEYRIDIPKGMTGVEESDFVHSAYRRMDALNDPVPVIFEDEVVMLIHYEDSYLIRILRWFPIMNLFIIGIFILLGFSGFQFIRNAERRGIWVGLSKETAHQLGTPLSSLMGWIELLRQEESAPNASKIIKEMDRDLQRLNQVAERFSKIGAGVTLTAVDAKQLLQPVITYIERRIPQWGKSIHIELDCPSGISIMAHEELFGWAIENLLKNAVDAIKQEEGEITIRVLSSEDWTRISVKDNGEGIPLRDHKNIFRPGWSSKKRGWGLGLSLVERIIREYHQGDISVESFPQQGTTFDIRLKTASNT